MSHLIVSMCEDYDNCQDILEMMLKKLDVLPCALNTRVLIKVNCGIGKGDSSVQGTNTVLVRNIINIIKKYGGIAYVGDSSPIYGYTEAVMCSSGLESAVKEEGGFLVNFDQIPGEQINLLGTNILLPKFLAEVDLIITVPKLKLNTISGFSGALKNQMGYIQGSGKSKIHKNFIRKPDFYKALITLNQKYPPDVAIMDAIEAMEGKGPSSGSKKVLNILAASRDLVSLDTFFNEFVCNSDDARQLLEIASSVGLGSNDLDDIQITGKWHANSLQKVFTLANLIETNLALGKILYNIREKGIQIKLDHSKCQQCYNCINFCPVGAISVISGTVKIDRFKCLGCFGCYHNCSSQAMELKFSFLFKKLFSQKISVRS